MLSNDLILKNFDDFEQRLIKYIGPDCSNKLIYEILGGSDKVMNAPFANTVDTADT